MGELDLTTDYMDSDIILFSKSCSKFLFKHQTRFNGLHEHGILLALVDIHFFVQEGSAVHLLLGTDHSCIATITFMIVELRAILLPSVENALFFRRTFSILLLDSYGPILLF